MALIRKRLRLAERPQVLFAWAALALACQAGAAEHSGASLEYQVKAAYLFNFTRFVEWPEAAQGEAASDAAPISICVLDSRPFGDALKKLEGQQVGERVLTVAVPKIGEPGAIDHCSILFLDRRANGVRDELLRKVDGKPVLTIGDSTGFLSEGGIVELVRRRGRILFRIDVKHARRAGLRVDPQLLGLALED